MKRSVRTSAAILATGIVLAACGTSDDATSATETVTEAPAEAGDDATQTEGDADGAPATDTAEAGTDTNTDTEEPSTQDDPPATEEPVDAEPEAETSTAPAEAALGGRAFAADLSAESDYAENVLPDLQVDDIIRGTKANIRNVFPAERPVLMWMWAPH